MYKNSAYFLYSCRIVIELDNRYNQCNGKFANAFFTTIEALSRGKTMEESYLIKPLLNRAYPIATHGEGIYIYDSKGKKYIDGSSGAVTASISHGVTEIIKAMNDQANKISFVYRTQFSSVPAERLAKKISEITPGNLNWSFFVNSGSEATETAFKIAIQYWQEKGIPTKNKIISRWMSYHGITIGALGMSGHVGRRALFEPLLEKYPSISAPYYYRDGDGKTIEQCDDVYADELEKEILRIGSDQIAAFIAEPIIGAAGGALTPSKDYFKKIKAVCEQYDILFIADEVMTGIGRTGKMFAMEHFGVIPDIMTTGKGMSGGYTPIAAAIISEEVMGPILKGSQQIMSGHTLSANPQSAATALAVLEYIEENDLIQHSAIIGKYLKDKLIELAQQSKIIGDVRGKGLFIGIEFVTDKITKKSFPKHMEIVGKIIEQNFKNGLIIYPANSGEKGLHSNAVIIAPPLTIVQAEIDQLIEIFFKSLLEVEEQVAKEISS